MSDGIPRASMRRRIGTLLRLVARANRWILVLVVVLLVVTSVGAVLQSLALRWMIDGVVDGRRTLAIGAAVTGGLAAGINGAAGRVYSNLQDLIAATLRTEIDRETMSLVTSMPGIEHLERPDYLDQVHLVSGTGDQLVRSAFSITDLMLLGVRIVISVWLLATVHPLLMLVPLFAVPSVLLTGRQQTITERAAEASAAPRRAADGLHAVFTEPAAAMEMRIFGAVDALDRRADELWHEAADLKLSGALRSALIAAAGWATLGLGYSAALLCVAVLADQGRATPGDVVMVTQLALQLRVNVAQVTTSVRQALGALRLTDRFLWLHDEAQHQADAYAGTDPAPERLHTGIRLDDVTFAYPGAHTPVLDRISLELPAGSTVAIVGANGAGKTTLVKLLCRLYDPTSGHIHVDGKHLTDIDVTDWRRTLAGSFQDHLRLECTALRSVGVGDPTAMDDHDRVRAALRRGGAERVVDALPAGLDTHLGKAYADGAELSGGQWQRLAISRGMMRPGPLLLLLDEPTAALDPSAEQAIFDRYAQTARGVRDNGEIVVLVSHRFSTVRLAEIIVVLDHGRIVGCGSHEQLLAQDGLYARMFREQAAAYS
jgi:ATP-binding cassette, subfamily B, bacterial